MDFVIQTPVILLDWVYWLIGGLVLGFLFFILIIYLITKDLGKHSGPRPGFEPRKYGDKAEYNVAHYLEQIKTRYGGHLFNNYRFKYGSDDSRSTEIDHLLITNGGIFVIETKGLTGKILGKDSDEIWTQIKDNYESTKTFKNPVIQNDGHIKALKRMLNIQYPPKFVSIVIFAYANVSSVKSNKVHNLKSAIQFIEELTMSKKYTNDFVDKMGEKFDMIQNDNYISKSDHEQNVIGRIMN